MSTEPISALSSEILTWARSAGYEARHSLRLSGDVSPRRYFRLQLADGGTAIAAVYPPDIADACARFLATTSLLTEAGVRVPAVLANDCERGWMLLEDVGDRTLFDYRERSWPHLRPWLKTAVDLAGRIARLDPAQFADLNPPLAHDLLERELDKTWRLFLVPAGMSPESELGGALRHVLDEVIARLGAAPLVACHRDFMARNLVPLRNGALVVLDHQDLRLGPPGYDLASLTNDSLFAPNEVIVRLLDEAHETVPSLEMLELAAVQRTFKAIGTYAEFAQRGNERHLPLIRPTLERGLDLLERHFAYLPIRALRNRLAPWLSPHRQGIC